MSILPMSGPRGPDSEATGECTPKHCTPKNEQTQKISRVDILITTADSFGARGTRSVEQARHAQEVDTNHADILF